MTEDEWENCNNPIDMLAFLGDRVAKRKLRLAACAFCRERWDELPGEGCKEAIQFAEQEHWNEPKRNALAETALSQALLELGQSLHDSLDKPGPTMAFLTVAAVSRDVRHNLEIAIRQFSRMAEQKVLSACLREVLGNPFRPVSLPPHLPIAVRQLAVAFDAGEPCAFALSDALQDANLAELGAHFAEPGKSHPKGCWGLDLILGRN